MKHYHWPWVSRCDTCVLIGQGEVLSALTVTIKSGGEVLVHDQYRYRRFMMQEQGIDAGPYRLVYQL